MGKFDEPVEKGREPDAQSPPRVRNAQSTRNSGQVAVDLDSNTLAKVFGVGVPEIAARLLSQLVNVLQPDPSGPVDTTMIRTAIALIKGFKPADAIEATTVTMLVAAQHAAMDMARRALHPEQTPAGRQMYMGLSLKAMRTFAQLLEGLNHGRGKGVTQRVIVERINVEPGGRAVVAAMQVHPGGQIESEYQSQEPASSDALPRPPVARGGKS
jgi:hypothetical protein